ncbi:hypothetical protein M441DRAFT_32169 [Trichoderma asperellum CBS 433.97]|uniref:Uncharacterized protein n=1 Tax=Trichoderma asperellum (strain ATCC 204424 / CBS 433.97 / NBRC 101777) TaxID=1042311 RepID=A0A2T3YRG7_TRIA4|nr:hypothetical protein M441DRAFT_32169 [Trichoderma asperellum CBS 433.97]PTB35158.1 hypothetical protein M441DRAFT_32169 [Trichoderma asperellum CBS 433.97]
MPETEDHTYQSSSRRTKRKYIAINYYEDHSDEEDEEEEFHPYEMEHQNIDTKTEEDFFNMADRQVAEQAAYQEAVDHAVALANRFTSYHNLHVDRDLLGQPERNLSEGSEALNSGELPKTIDKWGGCELVAERDGTFTLYTEGGERLLKNILSDQMEELFVMEERDGFITANSIKEDRWIVAKVLPRARNLYKVELLTPTANKRKSQTKENFYTSFSINTDNYDTAENEEGQRRALSDMGHASTGAVYIGYSMYMLGPVFVRPP